MGYYDANDKLKFISYITHDCKESWYPYTISFRKYCLGVTAGESEYKKLDGFARRAIALSIKTYTWFYLINPHDRTHCVDIKVWNKEIREDGKIHYTGMQDYAPFDIDDNPKITEDYNSIEDIWMEDSEYSIFEARHVQGDWEDAGKERSGVLKQRGCYNLAKERNFNTLQMIQYYFAKSDASKGYVQFFTTSGRVIK